MKRIILAVAVVVGVGVGLGAYLSRTTMPAAEKRSTEPGSAAVPPVDTPEARESVDLTTSLEPQRIKPSETLVASNGPAHEGVRPSQAALDAAAINRMVDLLVSPLTSYAQKHEAWKQLRESGKIDQAIAELEQRAANNPRTAEYQATLGQAYLQKCAVLQDVREQGILAMQADKAFETALNLDSSNWEARFTRAVAMSYWPPSLNKGDEVIQNFQMLIQQQESQAPQPQFAETYAWLGDQYQKAGRADDARAIWQQGAALFPDNEKLQKKLAPAQ